MTGKLCVSIIGETVQKMEEKARLALALGVDLLEFRLDSLTDPDPEAVKTLITKFSSKCILTLRPRWEGGLYDGGEEERLKLIGEAAEAKPAYIDLELRSRNIEENVEKLKKSSKIIISLHDYDGSLSGDGLKEAALKAMKLGDFAKIITTARTIFDNVRILSLYNELPRERLIAFAMGDLGAISRILSPIIGAPIVYACLPGEQAAPGQLSIIEMKSFLRLVGRC